MSALKVFIDSDVVISSLISNTGAANLLININLPKKVNLYVSDISLIEIKTVLERLSIDTAKFKGIVNKFKITKIKDSAKIILTKYKSFVLDEKDSHILAGAVKSKSTFLVTYNLKHYKLNELREFH